MLTLVPEEIEVYAGAHTTPLPELLGELVAVTKEEMVLQLEGDDGAPPKVKLGVPGLRLGWGYQLVRKARAGKEFVVTITENGFMYEDKIYSSLSAAAQNASGTFCRSGNDWFSLVTTQCTSVRDERGNVIARRGSLVVD